MSASDIKEWYVRNLHLFPLLILAAYSLGRALGNTCYYLFVISSSVFLVRRLKIEVSLEQFALWALVLLVGLSGFYDQAISEKDVVVFIISSLSAFYLPIIFIHKDVDKLVKGIFYASLLVLVIETVQMGVYYAFDYDGHPAASISIWNLMVVFPFLMLGVKTRIYAALLMVWVFVIVFFSASRAEFVAFFAALSVFLGLKYRSLFWFILIVPASIVLSVIVNLLFRGRSFAYGDFEIFLSRLTSRRSDMWFEAIRSADHDFWFGNGVGSSYQIYERIGASSMHNVLLELWWESGFLSVVLFVLLCFCAGRAVLKFCGSDGDASCGQKELFFAVSSAFTVVVVVMMLDKSMYDLIPRYYFFLFLGCLILMRSKIRQPV